MSIWLLLLISFVQITLGGAVSLGWVFYISAENSPDLSELQNKIVFTLLISFALSLLVSAGLAIYTFLAASSGAYYAWFAMPWLLLVVLLIYWQTL